MIPGMVAAWRDGALAVAGRATTRPDGLAISVARRSFYGLIACISDAPIVRGVQDFYLVDRRVIDDIVRSKPPMQLLRTYVAEHFGFDVIIDYARRDRIAGEPSLSLANYYSIAVDGLLLSGGRGIRMLALLSFGGTLAALGGAVAAIAAYAAGWRPAVVGWLSLLLAFLLLASFITATMGVALEYLSRIARNIAPGPRAQCWDTINAPECGTDTGRKLVPAGTATGPLGPTGAGPEAT